MTVASIIKHKLSGLISAGEHDTFLSLAEKLACRSIGALVVLNSEGGLAGIISERDLVRAIAKHQAAALAHTARDMMTKTVFVCSPEETEIQVMLYMLEKRIRHMPVVDGGKVVGMVSLGDAVKHRLVQIGRLLKEVDQEPNSEKRLGLFSRHLASRSEPKVG